jgi:rhodanese-related sulfurtransferase
MAEVNLFKFLSDNMLLVATMLFSGGMLLWPVLRRTGGGAVSTLEATLLMNQQNALVLDVRDAAEYGKGHLLNARNIPLAQLDERVSEVEKFKAKPVLLVCETGQRAGKAAAALRRQGFQQVSVLGGGIGAWQQAGLPLEK